MKECRFASATRGSFTRNSTISTRSWLRYNNGELNRNHSACSVSLARNIAHLSTRPPPRSAVFEVRFRERLRACYANCAGTILRVRIMLYDAAAKHGTSGLPARPRFSPDPSDPLQCPGSCFAPVPAAKSGPCERRKPLHGDTRMTDAGTRDCS